MQELLKTASNIINNMHDFLIKKFINLGYNFNDKQLHFIIIGILGMVIFFITNLIFRYISKYSISVISFIYTSTVLVVIVFALEIEQKITGKGRMEFDDIVAGIWGFIWLFLIYAGIRLIIYTIKKVRKISNEKNKV